MSERERWPVVAIALDSMELSLVKAGIEEGWLPTLAELARRGRSGVLTGLQALLPGAVWPTLVTGTTPDQHLAVLDRQLRPHGYAFERVTNEAIRRPPFWKFASDAGLRTTIASLYGAPIVPGLRGTQVIGWGAHDPLALWRTTVAPPEVLKGLDRAVGPRLPAEQEPFRTHADYRRNLQLALRGVVQQSGGLAHLMTSTRWDLFLGAFTEAHPVGHRMWHYHDPSHPRYDPDSPDELKDAIRHLYRDLDAGLGRVVQEAPTGAKIVVFAIHGMGPNRLLGDPAEAALERGGWLVRSGASRNVRRVRAYSAARLAAQIVLPGPIRRAIGSRIKTTLLLTQVSLTNVDWSRTRAFSIPGDLTSMIRLNVAGREDAGIVSPGEEYDQVCTDITNAMRQLVDDAGRPAVAEMVRTDALLGGPVGEILPDLIVRWSGHGLDRVRSDRLGMIEVPQLDQRSGVHRSDGWVIAVGPGVEPDGELLQGVLGRIEDLGPTLLSELGVESPGGLSGTPITALRA